MKIQLSDSDRCVLLAALKRLPWHLDALGTEAWIALNRDTPWAPHRTLEAWMDDRQLGA
jgi:hypothetical protein